MAGLTDTGFEILTEPEIRDLIENVLRDEYGNLPMGDTTLLGKLIGIISELFAQLWELSEILADSINPNAAVGSLLEALALLTGTIRSLATPSTVALTLTGDNATTVPAGSQASVSTTNEVFSTDDDALLGTATAWAALTAYVVGDIRSSIGAIWIVTVAGTSDTPTGPDPTGLTQGDTVVDATVTWRYVGDGLAYVSADATALLTGPTEVASGGIVTIDTAVSGWTSVYNLTDATPGTNIESDAELRLRRAAEVQAPGTGPQDAIRADMLAVAGVTSASIFVNDTDFTDADGVPPHSVEILVQGGDDQDLFDAILQSVDAGIRAFGSTSGTAVNSEGQDVTVAFSRPTTVEVWVDVTLVKDPVAYEGDVAVQGFVAAFGNSQAVGRDVVASAISGGVFARAIADTIFDISSVFIDTASSPTTSDTLVMSNRQLALYDTSRVTVNSSDGTP